jgi:hypothetical protein
MVRRRFFSAVSNHEDVWPILRDVRKSALLRTRNFMRRPGPKFRYVFFQANVARRLSNNSTFTPLRRMMKLCCSTDRVLFQAQ